MEGSGGAFTGPGLAVVLIGGLLILALPRRFVVLIFLLVTILVSMRQRIMVGGLDFMVHRIMLLFVWARFLMRSEMRGMQINTIDKWVAALTVWNFVAYTILWATLDAIIGRLGRVFDVVGLYFMFRALLRSREDFVRLVGQLTIVTVILAAFIWVEFTTHANLLKYLGAARTQVQVRMGWFRCQAAFGHPISAGVWGGTLAAMFIASWFYGRPLRKWALPGLACSVFITVASGSSSSLMALAACLLGFGFWLVRDHMRLVRWSVAATLFGLHMVMDAPVWALLGRMTIVGGSTGYHRYKLFDQFVKRFDEWWMLGVQSTAGWGRQLFDVTNQYVVHGIRGGIIQLTIFLVILALCHREVGRTWRRTEDLGVRLLAWSFGAALFAHGMVFWGYSYWDQITVLWYLMLAMMSSLHLIVDQPEEAGPEGVIVADSLGEVERDQSLDADGATGAHRPYPGMVW